MRYGEKDALCLQPPSSPRTGASLHYTSGRSLAIYFCWQLNYFALQIDEQGALPGIKK